VLEINTFRHCILGAKHQLCYWHAIQYLEARLTEDKPPAAYDPRKAHSIFNFIDPTWAPGVTKGWLEEGVHEDDAEVEKPLNIKDTAATEVGQTSTCKTPLITCLIQPTPTQATCLPPVFILKNGDQ
jgi:hypothetical protein